MLCISTSFWLLHAPKSWLKYFFHPISSFLLILNFFQWFHGWNQQKTPENEQKKVIFVYSSKLIDMQKLVDSLRGNLKIVSLRLTFSDVFCWFQPWNRWKRFEMNKKSWKRLKKVVRPALGCAQHPKAGQNTQQSVEKSDQKTLVGG